MTGNRLAIGAHLKLSDPLEGARLRDANLSQFFLTDPQGYSAPKPRKDAAALRDSDIELYVHAPYIINVATTNNRIRIPSRKLLSQHAKASAEVGALGLVVHGGHVGDDDDAAIGIDNWRKAFANKAEEGGFELPILIENTAGGENAMTRHLDVLARLWDAIGEYDPGFCLDTCHAFAAGVELTDVVDKVRAITGRIDLVHCNNSRDEFDSARDRHANLEKGQIDPELLVEVVRAAGAPVVCETPGDVEGQAADIAFLRERLG